MSTSKPATSSLMVLDSKALFYMALLALQFGIQPILTRRFTPDDVTRSTVILAQEVVKFGMAMAMLYWSTNGKPMQTAMKDWTVWNWIEVAGVPAGLYAVQNMVALQAYQNLDALTFNVLNQTKTLSAALCCWMIMGRRQSGMQILSLLLLLLSAFVMEKIVKAEDVLYVLNFYSNRHQDATTIEDSPTIAAMQHWNTTHFTKGVAPILLASFISGLAGALSEVNLQKAGGGRNPYLFSAELCVASILILAASLLATPDGSLIHKRGFFYGWNWFTWIPIFSNSAGGIIVGLVTKYAGSVRKGFALIFGILLSGLVQAGLQPETGVSKEQILGGVLAAVSLYWHATNPPARTPASAAVATSTKKKQE